MYKGTTKQEDIKKDKDWFLPINNDIFEHDFF